MTPPRGVPNQERLLQQLQGDLQKFVDGRTKEILVDYALTFDTPHGRRVLDDLRRSFCQGPILVPGYADVTAYNCGLFAVVGIIGEILLKARALGIVPATPDGR